MVHSLHSLQSPERELVRPRRTAALIIAGVGLLALADLGLLVTGALPWSIPAAMIALGLLVSASMAIGYDLARTSLPRQAGRLEYDGLAHDLRAPLTTTRTLLEMVEGGSMGRLSPEARDALGRASIAAARVEALLQHSLATSQAAPVRPTADLGKALTHALDAAHGRIRESGARIERGPLPTVAADATDMERVLTNLILNSIAHGRPGEPPRIRVGAERDGTRWILTVADDGPGVPPALRERAFEPGVRGRTRAVSPGFGLGLSTVRRLVARHGGRAWIDPTTDRGASVRIELPAA